MIRKVLQRYISNIPKEKFEVFDYKDCLNIQSLLSEEEIEIMDTSRKYFEDTLMGDIVKNLREKKFEKSLYRDFGEMGFLGCNLKEYGGSGISSVGSGLMYREIERVDSSYRSALSVQNALVIHPIYTFGTQQIKDKYLPKLISGELVGAFGLTEPNIGSDPVNLLTTAKQNKNGDWILNGSKNWITSSPIADIFIVWAKDVADGKIKGFVLDRSEMEGIETPTIEGKMSLVISKTGMIMMEDVVVPKQNQLQVEGMRGPFSCLNNARFGIAWGVLGAAEFCFEHTLQYTLDRKQFDSCIAGYQIPQKKFADMATDISLGLLSCIQVGRLKESDQLAVEMISMIKRNNCIKSLAIARECRDLLGGNGIVDEYHIFRHMTNLETVNTYEGTNDIHALILGRAITGIQAFSRKI